MLQLKIKQVIRIIKSVAFADRRRIFLYEYFLKGNLSQTLSNLSPQLNNCKTQAATTSTTERHQERKHLMILIRLVWREPH